MALTLRTWGHSHSAEVDRVERPTDEAGVQQAVRQAHADGVVLKPFGALHSWSDIALGQRGLSLDALDSVDDAGDGRVRVGGGIRLRALNRALDDRGRALSILGSVDAQSIAGAIGTGTHGSSLRHGNLGSFVRGVRLVTGTGDILDLGPDDPRLDAARAHLGALGVVTSVVLDTEPSFTLAELTTPVPLDDALADLPVIARRSEYVKVWWLPFTDQALIFASERTHEPPRFSPLARAVDEHVVNRVAFAGLLAVGSWAPGLVPTLNRLVGSTYLRARRRVATSHHVFHLAMPPVHREAEYAVPMERAAAALDELVGHVRRTGLPVDFILEVRFVKGDSGWMSPAHGRDTCQIGAYIAGPRFRERYFGAFEEIMLGHEGRPHWGKEFGARGDGLVARFPRGRDFLHLASELDPNGVFQGPFLRRLRDPA